MFRGSSLLRSHVVTGRDTINRAKTKRSLRPLAAALCALCLSPLAAWGQDGTIRVNADTNPVKIYVDVRDSAGQPVGGLNASAFQISENGSAQPVEAATTPEQGAASVVFIMDYSGSMESSGAVDVMRQAVSDALAKLDDKDRAAIIKFSGSVDTLSIAGFTNDYAQLGSFLSTSPVTVRGTIIFDAVNRALELFASAQSTLPSSSHSIILLSDGVDEGSKLTLAGIQDRLDDAGVSVFTLGLGTQINADALKKLSGVSGGAYARAADLAAVNDLYDQVTEGLTSEYVVTYNSALGLTDCASQSLQLVAQTPEGPRTYNADFRRCIPEPPPGTPLTTEGSSGGSSSGGSSSGGSSSGGSSSGGGSPTLVADTSSGGGGADSLLALLLTPALVLGRRWRRNR